MRSNRRNEPLMCLRASWRIPAPTAPRFIIFEDLHWCDPSTLEFLNRLVDRVETLPVLLLVTSRPGISVAWSDQPHVTTLVLNRISKRECEKMINSLARL